jgi:hypothetical protein
LSRACRGTAWLSAAASALQKHKLRSTRSCLPPATDQEEPRPQVEEE